MKRLMLFFMIIILIGMTMGCSYFNSNQVADADEGDQQLTVLIGAFSDPLSAEIVKILREVIVQFESNHPGSKVTLDTSTTYEQYDEFLLSTESEVERPDIIVVQPNKLNKYAENGILADLSTYASYDNMPLSDFYEPLLNIASRDGKWLTIPFAPSPLVVYYNKQWFEQANVAYPDPNWTWEDFSNTARLLKDSRETTESQQFGGLLRSDLGFIEPMILSQGGSILSPDGKQASGYLDSEASVLAIQYVNKFLKEQDLIEEMTNPTDFYLNYFGKRRTGMVVTNAGSLFYLQPELGDQLGVASLPSFPGGVRANPTTMLGLSIMEQSDDKQLAWELLKIMTIEQNEFTKQWSQWFLVNNIPLAKSTGQDEDPLKNVMLDELNYIHKSALEMNEYYVDIFREGSQLEGMQNKLMTMESAEEIQAQLTLMAEYIDNIMTESEANAAIEQNKP